MNSSGTSHLLLELLGGKEKEELEGRKKLGTGYWGCLAGDFCSLCGSFVDAFGKVDDFKFKANKG